MRGIIVELMVARKAPPLSPWHVPQTETTHKETSQVFGRDSATETVSEETLTCARQGRPRIATKKKKKTHSIAEKEGNWSQNNKKM
jgi:hypothetical protein